MAQQKSSLFDQSLDRSVFVTYFLGAIVPLLGFAVLSERLMPSVEDRPSQIALAAGVVATGVLSLVAFLALRRIVVRAVARMSDQNLRLEALLDVARELSEAPHAGSVAESAACWARRLAQADASWVLAREEGDKPFVRLAARGEAADPWLDAHHDEWAELVDRGLDGDETIRLASLEPEQPSVVITPLAGERASDVVLVVARGRAPFEPTEVDALRTLAAQSGVALTNAERGDVQRNFFSHMTDLVIAALDTHVQYRAGHSSRVAEVANRVGRAMGLDESALHDLHFASLLHDVGMLKIPVQSQRDPKFFRKHPMVGYRMLSRIRVWESAAPIVAQHHERVDGAGYPDGLVGDDICLGARILAVCDAWDAMRCDDFHRASIPVDEALAELRAHAGAQFDADVVSAFEALAREGAI